MLAGGEAMLREYLTRRQFVGLAGGACALLACGFGVNVLEGSAVFVRPPGASASEASFSSKCIRCQKCLSVCETDVIQLLPIDRSLRAHGTPVLDFSHSYCTFCMRCAEVCPTGALEIPPDEAKPVVGLAKINKDQCVAWSWSGCVECSLICPEEAVVLDERNRPAILADLCNGCGLCELQCPSEALRSYREADRGKGVNVVARGGDRP